MTRRVTIRFAADTSDALDKFALLDYKLRRIAWRLRRIREHT